MQNAENLSNSLLNLVSMQMTVREFETKFPDLIFVSDSQDVEAIKEHFGNHSDIKDFDSFFVEVGDGEYTEVYGMEGIIPHYDKYVEDVLKIIEPTVKISTNTEKLIKPFTSHDEALEALSMLPPGKYHTFYASNKSAISIAKLEKEGWYIRSNTDYSYLEVGE